MAAILIVDDDPAFLDLLTRILRRAGHDVTQALDGQAGLAACLQLPPQLLITGIIMPVMDGRALCRAVRQRFSAHRLPILVISGQSAPEEIAEHYAAGADAFLAKPMSQAAVHTTVAALLAAAPSHQDVV